MFFCCTRCSAAFREAAQLRFAWALESVLVASAPLHMETGFALPSPVLFPVISAFFLYFPRLFLLMVAMI